MRFSAEAAPFAAASLLSVLGAICTWGVGRRAPDIVRKLDEKYPEAKVPPHVSPENIGELCVWAADCAQSWVVLIAPPVAGLLLVDHYSFALGLAYGFLILIGAGVFLRLLLSSSTADYGQRKLFGLTTIGVAAIALNIVATIVVVVATG